MQYKLLAEKAAYNKYTPDNVLELGGIKIYWDISIITDKHKACNRPDVMIVDQHQKIAYLVDISISFNNNMQKPFQEKIRKYEELAIEGL